MPTVRRTRRNKKKPATSRLATVTRVEHQILQLRGHRVLLDSDLAPAYGVTVKQLNQAVKRNLSRFPPDFMFQLSWEETRSLRSQIVTLDDPGRADGGRGRHRKYPPYAFTEHGAVMLASVLNSPVAVEASIQVVRAFVRLRQLILTSDKLRRKLARIENKLQDHDQQFAAVFDAIRQLMEEDDEDDSSRPRIGYEAELKA